MSPVEIYGCVLGSISGLILIEIGVKTLFFLDTLLSVNNSEILSTLIQKTLDLMASSSSSSDLPTPEKTIFFGFFTAFKTLESSPPETTSNPELRLPSNFNIPRFGLALTA